MFSILKEEQRELLEKMSIGELRSLGQSFSVKSPTSQPKAELIEDILTVMYGDDEEVMLTETRGRNKEDRENSLLNTNIRIINYEDFIVPGQSRLSFATTMSDYDIEGEDKKQKETLEEQILKKSQELEMQGVEEIKSTAKNETSYEIIKR